MTTRHSARWKAIELKIALALGGRRVPVTGRQRGDAPDVEHPVYAIEIKHGKQIPALLITAMQQAAACVKGTAKVPLVVFHQHGALVADSLVIMRLKDFQAMHVVLPVGEDVALDEESTVAV